MEKYHFAFGVDANFVKYAGIVMTSIVLNNMGKSFCFHVVLDSINEEDREKLQQFELLYRNIEVRTYDMKAELAKIKRVSDKYAPKRLNQTVFLRLLMPMLLAGDIERVIYCDADMLCLGDVEKLWKMDLQGHPVGAVPEGDYKNKAEKINLKSGEYLNAGFMIIDLKLWRERNLSPVIIKCYQEEGSKFSMLEQDAINKILDGDWLNVGWDNICLMNSFNYYDIGIKESNIFWHFLNMGKPWINYADKKISSVYWSYVQRSLWHDMKPSEPTDIRIALLAGKNAERQGDYKTASRYLGFTAEKLMEFYLEKTGRLSESYIKKYGKAEEK